MTTTFKATLLGILLAAALSASPLACSNYTSLDQFIALGATGCYVDSVIYSNFTYSGSMTGNPADTAGPPIPLGAVAANQVSVVTDQGGRTGALQFRADWEISGPDTDPTSTPPPGGPNGPSYETLDLTFTVSMMPGHLAAFLYSSNQGSATAGGSLAQDAKCDAPCTSSPSPNYPITYPDNPGSPFFGPGNFADSEVSVLPLQAGPFTVEDHFQFTSTTDTSDAHLSVINNAVLETSFILNSPEPGTIIFGFCGLAAALAARRLRKH